MFEIRFRKIVQYFIVLVSFGRAVVLRDMPWQKNRDEGNLGLAKKHQVWDNHFLNFHDTPKRMFARGEQECVDP